MPEKFATSDVIARAKEWLETAAPRWRLQSMQHRSRYNPKTGEYKQLPMRIRRFLNGTPAGMKAAVLEVLKESAPYSGTVFDLEVDNLEYIPVNTFIRKDGNEHVTNLQDATYTIIQDLRIADDVLDRFGISDSSSCSEYSETEFRWDEPDIDPCPDGSQGIAYQIAGISRDPETDLFSYQIRKVQSLTQYSAPVVSHCDERKRVTVESWNNVYGEVGSFRFDPVKGGSLPIEIPEPCNSADGTTIHVAVSKNADCTYRIEVTKIESKTSDGQFSIYRDQYKVQESTRVQNAFSPLDKSGVEYYNGVMKRYTSELNDDGTWNNSIETETERQVPSSTVEVRVTPRATVTTRVDTNFPTAADAVPGGKYGSYKFTKTQGGLFVNEYVQYVRSNVGTLGILCTDTAFVKTHEKQDTVSSVPTSHVPSASRGVVTTWNYDTDADGIIVRRVRTDAEHEVRNAAKRASWGLLGTTRSYSHRSVSSSVAEQLLSTSKIGTSVEARMTNGRLWDVEVQSFVVLAGQSLGIDCQKTVYQHVHEISVSASAMGEEVEDAGNGKVYRRSFRRDVSTGAITKSESVTTELEVTESRRTVRVSARGKTIRTMTSNSASKPADASKPGETTEFEVTPGGRFNVSVEKTEPTEGPVSDECSKDLFQHTSGSTRLSKSKADTHVQETSDLSGVYRERRQVLGDDGVWSVSDVEHEEKSVARQREEIRVSRSGKVKRITNTQVVDEGAEPKATVSDIGKERIVEKTRGGKRNVTSVVVTPILAETDSRCEKDAFSHSHTTVKGVTGKGQYDVEDAGDGNYKEVSYRLNDYGAWEETKVDHKELQPSWVERDYQDAFGSTKITEEMSNANVAGGLGGKEFSAENLIRHVESQMTKGKRYNVRTTEEKPVAVSSGHLHFEKKTDKGLAYFYDFVVFRNQKLSWVRNEINWIQNRINYTGWEGSFSNNPGINISPNKFGLWDGSISLTTVFTPKQWASGGSTRDDNFEQKEYTVKDVSVSPLNTASDVGGIYLLKAVTTEKHKRGGGVGKDKLEAAVQGTILRGSTFYYHPSGQAFQYDIITSRKTEYSVIKASDGVEISS